LWPIITISSPLSRILLTSTWTFVERAGGVDVQSARLGLGTHRLRHAVRAEDHGRARGHLG
jgi:hypothetical protein